MRSSRAKHQECDPANGASGVVEKAHETGIECHDGGSEHEQPIRESTEVSLPERTDVVEIGKSYRSHSLRCCSEAGTSGSHGGSKTEGESDQGTDRLVGFGALPDRTS